MAVPLPTLKPFSAEGEAFVEQRKALSKHCAGPETPLHENCIPVFVINTH